MGRSNTHHRYSYNISRVSNPQKTPEISPAETDMDINMQITHKEEVVMDDIKLRVGA